MDLLVPVDVALGGPRGIRVSRTLPHKERRMVGAWCFLDAYGPHSVGTDGGMRVAPHPHTGLQTVSWLVAGEILHRPRPRRHRRRPAGLGVRQPFGEVHGYAGDRLPAPAMPLTRLVARGRVR